MSGYEDHFAVTDTTIGPQPWMQMRLVASEHVAAVSRSYDPCDGKAKDDLLQTLSIEWVNTSPIPQWVYGVVTRVGAKVTLQCRSRGYILTTHAMGVDWGHPTLDDPVEVSKFGIGADLGNGGILKTGGAYAINELRENSMSVPFMPHVTGWEMVRAGETYAGEVEVSFVSEDWEGTQVEGGDGDTESSVTAGDLRLDLFAIPAIVGSVSIAVPTVEGLEWDRHVGSVLGGSTTVDVPAGTLDGDVLVALVANNVGAWGSVEPEEAGWTLLHERAASRLLSGSDVHLKIWARTATGSEPAAYSFSNAAFSEQTSVIMALRDAEFDSEFTGNWNVATTVSKYKWKETHTAPSIDRRGQLLLCFSFFSHALTQNITQTPPTGMTEILDTDGSATSLAIASFGSPDKPTREQSFTTSSAPRFSGHSISGSILVPGVTVVESS